MKLRHGFVSNSSSSSFVLALPRMPKDVEELHSWMFPNGNTGVIAYDDEYPSMSVAEAAFRDITQATPMTHDDLVEAFSGGTVLKDDDFGEYYPGFPEYPYTPDIEYGSDAFRKARDAYQEANRQAAARVAAEMGQKNPDNIFVSVEYSDNDGPFNTTMEHGRVFENIPHLRISHH